MFSLSYANESGSKSQLSASNGATLLLLLSELMGPAPIRKHINQNGKNKSLDI